MVSNPRIIVVIFSGIESIMFDPNQTPGKPAIKIIDEITGLRLLFPQCRLPAPIPKAKLANLWVARAIEKGRPSKINAGS